MSKTYSIGRRRAGRGALAAALCLAAACLPARAQQVYDVTTAWTSGTLEGWSGGSGAKVTLTNAGGFLRVKFAEQNAPALVTCMARYDLPAHVRLTNLTFRLRPGAIPPSALRLYIHSSVGEEWYVPLNVPASDEWTTFAVPVEYSAGWTFGPRRSEAAFSSDLSEAAWVGVYVRRDASSRAQQVDLDDFQIQGFAVPQGLSIEGAVSYAGEQAGTVRVSADSVSGVPMGGVAVAGAAGAFLITGLPGATDYRVSAFLDSNGNVARDFWEAYGEWGGNPASLLESNVTDASFAMIDPASQDGLPYWWLMQHFDMPDPRVAAELDVANGDADGDGLLNYGEYRAGTDPTNSASVFKIMIDSDAGQPFPVLRWHAAPGRKYTLWSTDDLNAGFTVEASGIPADYPTNAYPDAAASGATKRFYRVEVE